MPMLAKLMNRAAKDGLPAGSAVAGRVPIGAFKPVWCRVDRGNRRRGMEYRSLGRSGLKVSPLCLDTMMFGGATDDATAARIVARARDQGVNFIDSADGYNGGKSEESVGRAIREHRSLWVPATKCANPTGQGPTARW